ncbi:MAG: hypothetical protein A3B37_00295 [Candidatus Sungbacteria bacterium RIFCSPLOWO2_01_FULL_59_16]|uniref:Glycosyl transferase family 1 n=1 Tax=Candidatus Sungbacteria bacterium RIFCSPLOWO2_01_FULL_59_16 TaxID=1802280 RepID=A0A1G2LA62_9BACT|nr:MAG: hypothetical protein A3B37_00295 [Candidatus Sungbacteria bacterium RIFCSPLOWO2_01_FULL_59_16]
MDNRAKTKLKILYIITRSDWGGAQRYVYDLATRLSRDEFDVAVAAGGSGPLGAKLAAAGIRLISIPALERNISILKEFASFASLLRIMFRERPNVVHLSSSKAGGLGALAARLASLLNGHRAMVIFTIHGWPFHENRPFWQRGLMFLASWLPARVSDVVVLINSADHRRAETFLPRRKLVLVRHGIKPPEFLEREEARAYIAAKSGRPLQPGALLVGTIAALTPNKGIRHLIDAANQVKVKVKSLKFKVIAIGDGEEKKRLQARIAELGLEDTVHLLGFVPDASRYLRGLDLFVLPSLKEGLPYALMEAMAAGLPAVGTSVGGIPDLIEDGVTGRLVPPKNPEAVAEAVAELLLNPSLRRMMGEDAKRAIERRFRIEPMLERTFALYRA